MKSAPTTLFVLTRKALILIRYFMFLDVSLLLPARVRVPSSRYLAHAAHPPRSTLNASGTAHPG